jgi:hypothetical protein
MTDTQTPARPRWHDLPDTVRTEAEHRFADAVVGERSQTGGCTPGIASRLELADSRRAFLKAIPTGIKTPTRASRHGPAAGPRRGTGGCRALTAVIRACGSGPVSARSPTTGREAAVGTSRTGHLRELATAPDLDTDQARIERYRELLSSARAAASAGSRSAPA